MKEITDLQGFGLASETSEDDGYVQYLDCGDKYTYVKTYQICTL